MFSLSFIGIQQLNGTSWKGSQLRVERAKESFLERLNRERAARQQGEHNTYHLRVDKEPDLEETEYSEGHNATSENQSSKVHDIEHSEKRKAYDDPKKDLFSNENTDVLNSDQVLHPDAHSVLSTCEKKKKDHRVEEKMLSSFKKFSSVWDDSDNENNEELAEADHGESPEEQQVGGGGIKPECKDLFVFLLRLGQGCTFTLISYDTLNV